MIRRQLAPAIVVFLAFTVLTGIAYPLLITAVAQVSFPNRADGSLIETGGKVVGSRLLGQAFSGPRYFQPRPSAAGYDAMAGAPSNLSPTNEKLVAAVHSRARAYRRANGLAAGSHVPIDALTASGSGLDPHISPANARLQAPRVARVRGLPLADVLELVRRYTQGRALGFLGEPGVNVLELNLALDGEAP